MELITYILGLDISLTGTGVTLYNLATDEHLSYVVKSKPEKDFYERCAKIVKEVDKATSFIDRTFVICEGFAFGAKGSSIFQIAELSGILRYHLRKELNLPFERLFLVPPTTVKSFVCGQGNAPKELMLKEVFKKWGFDHNDNNVVDAYAIAQYGRALLGYVDVTKAQRKVMDRLLEEQGITLV